ncbi:ASCH domain-containing protein [Streptomyces sp. NBC_00233]|uniref:ASCH domain-containing protein n=1 Tax=Streptomyces sp. NBC_00233 TaxID=2975686 RepID=UPI0022515795|nr:ASCH domain-containing protein [Streptomyces sp. NBC_00233]MCX5233552.1 ASCH domain-containing protein [Streptomyces sp. NBC_00233]
MSAGYKTATTGLLEDYAKETEGLECLGERMALLDGQGHPIAVIEITGVEVKPFSEVTWEHVQAEGEGDVSLEEWRAGIAATGIVWAPRLRTAPLWSAWPSVSSRIDPLEPAA